MLNALGFGKQFKRTQEGRCSLCNKRIDNRTSEFRNEISRREYRISGMCQKCQDDVFGED